MAENLESKLVGKVESEDRETVIKKYTEKFSDRYGKNERFKTMVHKYLELSKYDVFLRGVASWIRPGWYKKKTTEMINNYAIRIYEKEEKADLIEEKRKELERLEELYEKEKLDQVQAQEEYINAKQEHDNLLNQKEEKLNEAQDDLQKRKEDELKKAEEERQKLIAKTDPETIVKGKLEEYMSESSLIKVDDNGCYKFNDEELTKKLEDIFLDEVLDEIKSKTGKGSFVKQIKRDYEEFFDSFEDISDLSQLPNVDWMQSALLSKRLGLKDFAYPFMIVRKYSGGFEDERACLDTAVTIDGSGSMIDNNRMDAARKTGLAINSLMRRLNPNNLTQLSIFNKGVNEVTSLELMKFEPYNGTDAPAGLRWLRETLTGRGPSIAYFITDGIPNNIERTIQEAKKFKQHPEIMLRIFLIDGTTYTEGIMKKVGIAAGDDTKIASIKNYELSAGVITNLADSIRDMQSIMSF